MFCDSLKNCTFDNINELSLEGKQKKCKVVRVYDGDTLWLATKIYGSYYKLKVRMMGYDSPELKPKLNIVGREQEINAAQLAKSKLESLILDEIVSVKFFKNDKYGRPLCNIYLYKTKYCIFKYIDNKSINSIMIEEGHGYKYSGGTKQKYKDLKIIV